MTYSDRVCEDLQVERSADCSSGSPSYGRRSRLNPAAGLLCSQVSQTLPAAPNGRNDPAHSDSGEPATYPEMQTGGGESRLEIRNYLTSSYAEEIARDVRLGLSGDQKRLPSKYFYDEQGSRLFEEICMLPEYYPTRTEMAILQKYAGAIMEPFAGGDLVEMGSGANWKICRLLDAAWQADGRVIRYVPVDVSEAALRTAAVDLIRRYDGLSVLGIVADFTRDLGSIPDDTPKIVSLFGGTLGNFTGPEAESLLGMVAGLMHPGDRFLLGLDMVKERAVLETAYNDSQGVTAAFNRNILHVVNRELDARFDPSLFDHVAFFNEDAEQIEMHLAAKQAMTVDIGLLDTAVEFREGETIHTEISRKFSRESAVRLFERAGLAAERWFTDDAGWFSLVELARDD